MNVEQSKAEQANPEQTEAVQQCLERLEQIRSRIADAGGDPTEVQVLAVTKGFGAWAIEAAHAIGLTQVGENYAQELANKWQEVPAEIASQTQVHFIGHLQTNKVRLAATIVHVWQCVDRSSLVTEIAKRNTVNDLAPTVMLQLNVSGVASQGGCSPDQAGDLLAQATDTGLDVIGVMAIGAQGSPEEVRSSFKKVRRFADDHDLLHRSIGMSGDLELAVAAGSTMLRIGTALFGPRS